MSVLDSPNSSVLSVRDDGVTAQRARMRPQLGPQLGPPGGARRALPAVRQLHWAGAYRATWSTQLN